MVDDLLGRRSGNSLARRCSNLPIPCRIYDPGAQLAVREHPTRRLRAGGGSDRVALAGRAPRAQVAMLQPERL
jgi:hypothetical protein